jgi:hypothetical protein
MFTGAPATCAMFVPLTSNPNPSTNPCPTNSGYSSLPKTQSKKTVSKPGCRSNVMVNWVTSKWLPPPVIGSKIVSWAAVADTP